MMRFFFKNVLYLVLVFWFSLASAGSYDDFFIAIKRDDPGTMKALLERGFDPNTIDPKGFNGLYLALREPSPKVAQVLIDWPKTNIDMRSPADETPLMMAALRGQVDVVRKLIAKGADVNKTGWTPLHYAATKGHVEIIALLLEEHAYIDAESPNGTTPLMMAAQYGTREAVKLLLDEGADPLLKNELGLTAIDFAHRAGRQEVAEMVSAAARAKQPKGQW